MAAKPGAWGIDIGQAGLKAIRLEINDATEQVVATAFDFIAHPKILSQPDAIPDELISQALEKFLKQNDVTGDVVAVSVPGQSALARFIQLPPVEASKVSEIVKYEARQQIPFALEDVVWDYQTLGKGTEESGFLLEAEVGLFAMKRDQVMNQLRPFTNAGMEIELIQIAPLALYNFLSFDQLGIRLGDEVVAMDSYTILLDMGADNTTLLVSNGQKIWIRNVPIGGNHFTRALTKEMKLTFAKAEHLKCNATKSPDPRAVFQALRPVFNDYVSEIQRSIGYFSSVNRDAKISKVVGLGNGFKLAGLQKFLQQNLQYEVERIDAFGAISPEAFKDAALFEENILSFPVCYGVALQALKQTRIRTSLLPKEITTARTIARKKPWAVGTAAVLLVGLATSAFGYARVYQTVSPEIFSEAEKKSGAVVTNATKAKFDYADATGENEKKRKEGDGLVRGLDRRSDWLKLYKAVDECLPRDAVENPDVWLQNRIRILSLQARWYPKLEDWYGQLGDHQKSLLAEEDRKTPPTGGGLVVTLQGEHFHDETHGKTVKELEANPKLELEGMGEGYLMRSFVRNLQAYAVPSHNSSAEVLVRGIGITHATVAQPVDTDLVEDPGRVPPPLFDHQRSIAPMQRLGKEKRRMRMDDGQSQEELQRRLLQSRLALNAASNPTLKALNKVQRTSFVVEFVWKPEAPPPRSADPSAGTAAASAPGAAPAGTAAPPGVAKKP